MFASRMKVYPSVIDLILTGNYIVWYYLLGVFSHVIAPFCLLLFIVFKFIRLHPSRKWIQKFFLVCSLSFFSFMARFYVVLESKNLKFDLNAYLLWSSSFLFLSFTFFIFSVFLNLKWLRYEFKKKFKNRVSISLALLLLIITLPLGVFLIFHLKRLIFLSYGGG